MEVSNKQRQEGQFFKNAFGGYAVFTKTTQKEHTGRGAFQEIAMSEGACSNHVFMREDWSVCN